MQKKYRLPKGKTFNYIYRKGKSVTSKQLVLIFAKSRFPMKAGFVVSNKHGKAVVRNKVRRRLKEIFRANIQNVQDYNNYIFIARNGIEKLSFDELSVQVVDVLKKSGNYLPNNKQ